VRAVRTFLVQTVRAVKILARDGRVPRPLRGLVVLGLLPVPGPFDEAVLVLVGGVLFAFYREPLRSAWREADAERFANRMGTIP
jgi:hypothetical protein